MTRRAYRASSRSCRACRAWHACLFQHGGRRWSSSSRVYKFSHLCSGFASISGTTSGKSEMDMYTLFHAVVTPWTRVVRVAPAVTRVSCRTVRHTRHSTSRLFPVLKCMGVSFRVVTWRNKSNLDYGPSYSSLTHEKVCAWMTYSSRFSITHKQYFWISVCLPQVAMLHVLTSPLLHSPLIFSASSSAAFLLLVVHVYSIPVQQDVQKPTTAHVRAVRRRAGVRRRRWVVLWPAAAASSAAWERMREHWKEHILDRCCEVFCLLWLSSRDESEA